MDGPDHSIPWTPYNDDDDDDDDIWGIVDSWFNENPLIPLNDHDHDHHGNVGINGGDKGKDMGGQGMQSGVRAEDPNPTQDQLSLQVVSPSAPNPHSCSSCHLLREITLTNGTHTTKLDIHGQVGHIFHAIHFSNYGLASTDIQNYQLFDFCTQRLEEIKGYIKGYIEEHRQNGYILVQEPLSLFYQTLCTGYDWLNADHHAPDFQTNNSGATFEQGETSNPQIVEPQEINVNDPTFVRTELSIQRERVKKMKFEDFAKYFDKTISDASVELHLCATVIKKKLRSYGIDRWPYRKVKSIERKLSLLKEKTGDDYKKLINEGTHQVETEIQNLEQQLADILCGKLMPC